MRCSSKEVNRGEITSKVTKEFSRIVNFSMLDQIFLCHCDPDADVSFFIAQLSLDLLNSFGTQVFCLLLMMEEAKSIHLVVKIGFFKVDGESLGLLWIDDLIDLADCYSLQGLLDVFKVDIIAHHYDRKEDSSEILFELVVIHACLAVFKFSLNTLVDVELEHLDEL